MSKLKGKYERVVEKYIERFEELFGVDFCGWIGNKIGETAMFEDYFFEFSDIRYSVDNNISYDYISDWYYFVLDFKKCFYNLDSYCRLRRDAEKNVFFEVKEFEKELLYMRIKGEQDAK